MSRQSSRESQVREALKLLREGKVKSPTAAAKATSAPRRTVSDRWTAEVENPATPAMDLEPGEIPVIQRDYSHLDKLHVFPLGDVHKGSSNYEHAKWNEWLDYVADTEHASFLGTGDFLNVALKDSVSDVYTENKTVREAKWELRDELKPIAEAGRLDLLLPGNHEGRITKATGDCPIHDVAQALEVPYAPVAALVVYQVGDVSYEVAIRHGSGSGRAGAQATRMERESQTIIADVYVAGHTHRQQVLRGAVFYHADGVIRRRRQLFVTSGSFLSYEEYAARFGLPPADVGAVRIRLDGRRKDPHASV